MGSDDDIIIIRGKARKAVDAAVGVVKNHKVSAVLVVLAFVAGAWLF